jgi:hypothetical protein
MLRNNSWQTAADRAFYNCCAMALSSCVSWLAHASISWEQIKEQLQANPVGLKRTRVSGLVLLRPLPQNSRVALQKTILITSSHHHTHPISKRTGSDVVLSSTWRYDPAGLFRAKHWGVPFIDVIPDLPGRPRRDEILAWLKPRQNVLRFGVLDDETGAIRQAHRLGRNQRENCRWIGGLFAGNNR